MCSWGGFPNFENEEHVVFYCLLLCIITGFPGGSERVCLQCRRPRFNLWVKKIPWRREWLLTPVLLPGESQGQGSLVGCCLWGCTELDMTEVT